MFIAIPCLREQNTIEETIKHFRKILETFAENIIGKLSNNNIVIKTLDTTNISKQELLTCFLDFVNSIVLNNNRKGGNKK